MSQTDPVVVCVCVLLRGVEAWDAGVEHLAERESKNKPEHLREDH